MPGVHNPRRATLAIAFALAGCTRALEPAKVEPAPVAPMDSIEVSLFLIGDAGSKAYDGEPVLKDLAKQSDSLRAVKQYVVFLGDNVYPRGVPPLGSPRTRPPGTTPSGRSGLRWSRSGAARRRDC